MSSQDLRCLFESADVVALEKPAGFLSVPSIKGKADPRPVVGLIAQKKWGSLYPVHRLDLEVAGVLLFARNPQSQKKLHHIWEDGEVQKIYRALSRAQSFEHWPVAIAGADLEFRMVSSEGVWESKIVQGKKRSFVAEHGDLSQTHYKLETQMDDVLQWRLSPLTGRRHQLRLEMSRHGFPLIGDSLYGGDKTANEIALVAESLQFTHKRNLQLPDGIELGWNWNQWQKKFTP